MHADRMITPIAEMNEKSDSENQFGKTGRSALAKTRQPTEYAYYF